MANAKGKSEGYQEDTVSLPTPPAANATDNKFDGESNPAQETFAQTSFGTLDNDFPRQTGSDSLSEEEAYLS